MIIKGNTYNKSVELNYKPCEIFEQLPTNLRNLSEMSKLQLGFLCGLITQFGGRKTLEVGVSAGGTTAAVMNCLSQLYGNDEAELFSVDVAEKWYKDDTKRSGFVGLEAQKVTGFKNYKLFTGGSAARYLSEIGGGIDFLILDTAHSLPGEILDFLSCLPFLNDGACVVLHDVMLNHYALDASVNVTKLLLDAVSAEKYYMFDNYQDIDLGNIAAFRVDKNTRQNIIDVFSSLTNTWSYLPSSKDMEEIKRLFEDNYDIEYLSFYEQIVLLQRQTLSPLRQIGCFKIFAN